MFALNDSPSYNYGEEGDKQIVKQDAPSFLRLSCNFFKYYDKRKDSIIDNKEVKHFTDLLRYFFCSVPGLQMKPNKGDDLDSRICATKLEDAGLKFKVVGKNDRRLLLDIRFVMNPCLRNFPCFNLSWLLACLPCLKKTFPRLERMQPILEIPVIVIDDNTEVTFRNLIALEQCHYPFQPYICNYAELLDYLINSEKDVDLLVEKRIIDNCIGSNEAVAKLINKLCLEITVPQTCYSDLGKDINTYNENPWNRIMAGMKSKFFCDFWRGAATTFAIFVTLDQIWGLVRPFVINK
ncbi:uncharacterized protein LOC133879185 [Alnus glutinosa]|nr:uncharacterized protein LOC133879185 [Alnus glutinosa]